MAKKVAKLELGDLLFVAITLVVVGITIALGLQVTSDIKTDLGIEGCLARSDQNTTYNETSGMCQNATGDNPVAVGTYEFNSTIDSQDGVANLSEKLPTVGLVAGIVVVIGLLIGGFMRFKM